MAGYGFNIGLDGHRIDPLTEKEAEEIAEGLTIIYDNARERMLTSVSRRLSSGRIGYGWAERKSSEVLAAHAQLAQDLDKASKERTSLLSGVMERAYATGNQQFFSDMRSVLGATAHISPNAMKAGYILADLNNSLDAAERRILRQFDDRYADVIGAVSAEMATGVMNTRQAVGDALQQFADRGITGFIDRGGHHWTLENYAEMAVLTAIERSTISGYVDTMQSYGYDLAVIDGHIGSCPICEAWEGVIISVSGEDPHYPSLNEAEGAGCFHPRCMHGIHTYYPGITHEPKGGFRDEPREVRPPSVQYTARSRQRYCERMAQKYRDRALVAQTPQQKAQAKEKAREWKDAAEEQREIQFHTVSSMAVRRSTIWPEGDGGLSEADLQALEQYAKSHGVQIDVNSFKHFEGASDTVRGLIDSISAVARDFPLLSDPRRGVVIRNSYGMEDNDFAQSVHNSIFINNNAFRNARALANEYQERVTAGWFAKGTSFKSIGYHESGHIVVNTYQLSRSTAVKGVDYARISEYAGSKKSEAIAESFSAHYSGADTAESLTIFNRCVNMALRK